MKIHLLSLVLALCVVSSQGAIVRGVIRKKGDTSLCLGQLPKTYNIISSCDRLSFVSCTNATVWLYDTVAGTIQSATKANFYLKEYYGEMVSCYQTGQTTMFVASSTLLYRVAYLIVPYSLTKLSCRDSDCNVLNFLCSDWQDYDCLKTPAWYQFPSMDDYGMWDSCHASLNTCKSGDTCTQYQSLPTCACPACPKFVDPCSKNPCASLNNTQCVLLDTVGNGTYDCRCQANYTKTESGSCVPGDLSNLTATSSSSFSSSLSSLSSSFSSLFSSSLSSSSISSSTSSSRSASSSTSPSQSSTSATSSTSSSSTTESSSVARSTSSSTSSTTTSSVMPTTPESSSTSSTTSEASSTSSSSTLEEASTSGSESSTSSSSSSSSSSARSSTVTGDGNYAAADKNSQSSGMSVPVLAGAAGGGGFFLLLLLLLLLLVVRRRRRTKAFKDSEKLIMDDGAPKAVKGKRITRNVEPKITDSMILNPLIAPNAVVVEGHTYGGVNNNNRDSRQSRGPNVYAVSAISSEEPSLYTYATVSKKGDAEDIYASTNANYGNVKPIYGNTGAQNTPDIYENQPKAPSANKPLSIYENTSRASNTADSNMSSTYENLNTAKSPRATSSLGSTSAAESGNTTTQSATGHLSLYENINGKQNAQQGDQTYGLLYANLNAPKKD
eukprot:Colp12_sorted_trinity150504_noHs@28653